MGGPMNIFDEYMGGLKIYSRQWLRLIFNIGGTIQTGTVAKNSMPNHADEWKIPKRGQNIRRSYIV